MSTNFLLIDDRLKETQKIIDSLNNNTDYVLIDYYNDSLDELYEKIPNKYMGLRSSYKI